MESFTKPAIDVEEQLQLLKSRGLKILDESRARCFLQAVSFFRLTPYMRPFQQPDDPQHHFRPGAGFRDLSRLYDFDRRLRLLGVVCGRGRNPTLRLWPTIFSGKIDVFPGDRRSRLISSMTSVAPA